MIYSSCFQEAARHGAARLNETVSSGRDLNLHESAA